MKEISKQEQWINYLLLIFFAALAFYCAQKTTSGLFLPADDDTFRDMAIAENIKHGQVFTDPSYRNELLWYNPGLPGLEAFISWVTGVPLNLILAQAGKYLNLFIPFTLFLLCAKLFDKRVAFGAATASFFFVCGNDYGTHMSGYTYILLPICFTQSLFYLVLILTYRTFESLKNLYFLLLGLAAGSLFLFHSAPAFIFCIILGLLLLFSLIKKEMSFKEVIVKGLFFSVTFLLVASPLLYNIFIHYSFHVKNIDPTQWVYFLFRPGNGNKLIEENVNIYLAIAVIGLIHLIRNKSFKQTAKRIILYWFFTAAIIFIYLYIIVILRTKYGIHLPGFVPSVDIFFYVKACESVLFGIGILAIIKWLIIKIDWRIKFNPGYLLYAVVLCLVLVRFPSYYTRKEFGRLRMLTIEKQQNSSFYNMYEWIKQNTLINDVLLCSLNEAQYPVMASGRKLIVTGIYYSNPYVSYLDRKIDCDNLLQSLQQTQHDDVLFDKYKVNYLIINKKDEGKYISAKTLFPTVAYNDNDYVIRKK
ncbi:hypothetical protein FRZ67_01410 [Panacibacter ginsenosidivorans]|uniref:Glycosyltransferase RgtA/B/C/D-like domain-containing protein n=1 Tax=Panacibacter ginsenosidivorans TaxID=1813871 RepID=A0A5B8V5X6_9BACT|nr:hypothetical protein [Panacibacter ginsenosidivorans]QEC66026.1 hypothetical protein FRZ67_01410 [Panacibacter ginsenosidivorans]